MQKNTLTSFLEEISKNRPLILPDSYKKTLAILGTLSDR